MNFLWVTLGFPETPTIPHKVSLSSSNTLAETLIVIFVFAAEIFGTYHVLPDIQFFYPRALDQQSLLTNSVNLPYLYQVLEFSGSLIFHSSCVSF
jgi:hypothetical protein